MTTVACGIDIGGSGVKSALADLETGEFIGECIRIDTPKPVTSDAVANVCRQVLVQLEVGPEIPVGIAFPAPVIHGVIPFMANLGDSWVGIDVSGLMVRHLSRPIVPLNNADAAGFAEITYGAVKGVEGLVILTTLGTDIGSALIMDGHLTPNTELGHLGIDGYNAEKRASSGQKTLQDLNWKKWAKRPQRYCSHVEMLLSPDLFVVGGGASKNHDEFMPLLDLKTPMVSAQLCNTAGIVGAASYVISRARGQNGSRPQVGHNGA